MQLELLTTSPHTFHYTLFHASHGPFWPILSVSLHGVGLVLTATGLHVRISEIEREDQKRSSVFLSAEPGAILGFLGLGEEEYWRG